MRINGYSNLSNSILKYHKGFRETRRNLGIKQLRIADELELKELDNLLIEISIMLDNYPELNGRMPSQKWLIKNGYMSLVNSIQNHHGGFRKIREILKSEQLRVEDGHYKNIVNIIGEFERIFDEHLELDGKMPSVEWMRKNGYGKLYYGIHRYHGGFPAFREKLSKHREQSINDHYRGNND